MTDNSRSTEFKASIAISNDTASLNTGLSVPFLTDVFFFFARFPATSRWTLTYESKTEEIHSLVLSHSLRGRCLEWAQERTGRARETREGCLP